MESVPRLSISPKTAVNFAISSLIAQWSKSFWGVGSRGGVVTRLNRRVCPKYVSSCRWDDLSDGHGAKHREGYLYQVRRIPAITSENTFTSVLDSILF